MHCRTENKVALDFSEHQGHMGSNVEQVKHMGSNAEHVKQMSGNRAASEGCAYLPTTLICALISPYVLAFPFRLHNSNIMNYMHMHRLS
jgi:hypothetical protein